MEDIGKETLNPEDAQRACHQGGLDCGSSPSNGMRGGEIPEGGGPEAENSGDSGCEHLSGAELPALQSPDCKGCGACENGCLQKPECFGEKGRPGGKGILRWGCGCIVVSLFLLLAFLLLAGNVVVSVSKDAFSAVGDLGSCAFDSAKGVAAAVAERLRADPRSTVYVDLKFVGADGVDKLVCAEVRREVGKVVKFEDFKVFSALLEIRATAIFEYYVPLEKMRIGLSINPGGKLDVRVFFPAPRLSVPVKFNIDEYEVSKSFIPKLNEAANEYMRSDFPRMLEEYGNQEDVVSHAREVARKRLEQTVRSAILPLIGVSGNSGESVRVVFDSAELEKPAQITHKVNVKAPR